MDHKSQSGDKRDRDARVVKTRAALRRALVALLGKQPLETITVQMIVAEGGVGYATFFRHYTGVEILLRDIADELIADFITSAMPAIVARQRGAVLEAMLDYVEANRVAIEALLFGAGDVIRRDIIARAIAQASALPVTYAEGIPRELAITHSVGSTIEMIGWWLQNNTAIDKFGLKGLIAKLIIDPLH